MGLVRRCTIDEKDMERWQDVDLKTYRVLGAPAARKQILVGPDDGATNFAMRIYQLPPGRSSSEHEHRYDHGVLITKGRATVLLGEETHAVEAGDFVWVQPSERHRFTNSGPDLLQFVCVVPPWGENDAVHRPPAPEV
jgi:quercetin dioxygenase-like cupin family protein